MSRSRKKVDCAACSGRVVDGGCPTCRVSRNRVPAAFLPPQVLLLLARLLAVLVLLTVS